MNRKDQILIAEAYQLIRERDTVGRAYRITRDYNRRMPSDGAKAYYDFIKKHQRNADVIEKEKNNKIRVEHAIWTDRWEDGRGTHSAEFIQTFNKSNEQDQKLMVDGEFHKRILNRLDLLLSKQDHEISVTVKKDIALSAGKGTLVLTGIADNLLEYYPGDAATRYSKGRDGKEIFTNKFPTTKGGFTTKYDEAIINLQDVKWDGYYNGLAEPDSHHGHSGTVTEYKIAFFYKDDPDKKVIGYRSEDGDDLTWDEIKQLKKDGKVDSEHRTITRGVPLFEKVDEFLSNKGLKKYNKLDDLYKLRST